MSRWRTRGLEDRRVIKALSWRMERRKHVSLTLRDNLWSRSLTLVRINLQKHLSHPRHLNHHHPQVLTLAATMIKFTAGGDSWTMELISEFMIIKDQDHLHHPAVADPEDLIMDMDQINIHHHLHHPAVADP